MQLSLAATAWTDLARRPADQVNNSEAKWAAIISINFVGPILYFTKGREKQFLLGSVKRQLPPRVAVARPRLEV